MRALVLWKDGLMVPMNRVVKDAEHARALEVCWRTEGVQFFNAEGKVAATKPLLPEDQIVFIGEPPANVRAN